MRRDQIPLSNPKLSRAINGEQDRDYAAALTACETLASLRALVHEFAPLALDALPIVDAMTKADFAAFRRGLKRERRGQFAGDVWAERFGAVLMPLPMLRVTELAAQYRCRFGVAWFRLKELRPELLTLDGAHV